MRANTKNVTVEMMIGLPGSGKTTKANELGKGAYDTCVISVDDYKANWDYRNRPQTDIITIAVRRKAGSPQITRFIIDGLFLTNNDIIDNLVSVMNGLGSYLRGCKVTIKLHYWNENREKCLKNDGGRREVSSATTILNAPYEELNMERINAEIASYVKSCGGELNPITNFIKHDVILKPNYERYFKPYVSIDKDNKIRSEKWCTGGTCGNCWDRSLSPVSPEEPCEFVELDDLLENICPTITFLQYKKIQKQCVTTEDHYEPDYYGGGSNYLNWVCDLRGLYDLLEEFGYIQSEE